MTDSPRPIDGRYRERELPARVVQARAEAAADDEANETVARPMIDGVLEACRIAAGELEARHREIVDKTDLDPAGYSRAAAIWLLSGREIGLLRALLVQISAGIGNESLVTGRAIHEATRVLGALIAPDADDLVRIWLDDEGRHGYVRQGPARAAWERLEAKLAEMMEAAEVPTIPSTTALTEELYDRMSRSAHNRRSSCLDSYWARGRVMSYGRQPSAIRRASYASWAASMTGEVLNAVGDAIGWLRADAEFYSKQIVPLREAVEAVRETYRLDEATIRTAAGTL